MSDEMRDLKPVMHDRDHVPFWYTRSGLVFCGFLIIAAFFLIAEHRAHIALAIPYLPWLLLLACPLMHVFMHGGHGYHRGHSDNSEQHERASEH
jgi:hypothetical protein